MLHACIEKFNVTGTVENFLETKQDLSYLSLIGTFPFLIL